MDTRTKPSVPAIIILFGITGDLAQRKLLPALYHLYRDNLLHEDTVILGITRRDVTTEEMVKQVQQSLEAADDAADETALRKVQQALRMHTMSQVDPEEYKTLKQILEDIEAEKGICMDRLFYLSIPPQMFGPIVRNLGEQGLNQSCQHGTAASRLLIEKPFGFNLQSAEELIADTGKHFQEEQIFRIDHYIAKDTVQNIVSLRQEVAGIEPLWNSKHVDRIELSVFEKLDIEGRATFYEEVGALRDFIQSHLLQVLALALMDIPATPDSETLHRSRLQALEQIVPLTQDTVASQTVRAQYDGYREVVRSTDSVTETFASVTLDLKGERWQGTKATLKTGKALPEKVAKMVVYFKADGGAEQSLRFWIQPDKGIELDGSNSDLKSLREQIETFSASHRTQPENPLGYERVFLDAIRGDHNIFTTSQEVLAAWRIVEAAVVAWGNSADSLRTYPKGSWLEV